MRSWKSAFVLLGLLIGAGVILSVILSHSVRRTATMLLVNGVIYTVSDPVPRHGAIAIRGGTIAAVGPSEDLRSSFDADTVIDLHGKPVYPGFIDSHAHLEGLGAALMNLNLSGIASAAEAAARVAAAAREPAHGGWIRGRGWDQNRWPGKRFPDRHVLDRVCPDIPVFLKRVDGHAVWVNSKVLSLAGITRQTPDPPGGRILRDARGEPTGVFVDNAVNVLEAVIPPPSREERIEAIRRAVAACLSFGLTEVHDMGVDREGVELYASMIESGQFPFRVYVAVDGSSRETWEYFRRSGPLVGGFNGRLTVRAVKLYADGALGSRGAALFESYADEPGNRGLTLTSTKDLLAAATQSLESGFQLCTHAIGDRANAIVLDVYQEAFEDDARKGREGRFRVEHAQVLAPAEIPRFAKLGVLPMMQPTHCTSDMPWAESRLGPTRVAGAYAWRSLLRAGSIIPGGSDFPVESPNPLLGVYAAVTRQDPDGSPSGGWYPDQCMTREEALKSFTVWGAYAGLQEKVKGTIEPGKWADLVVLSDDIMTIPAAAIPQVRVEMTLVGGSIVYRSTAQGVAEQ
ncbi:MAG: amidohydrolase family protein [Bacteroidota bacterium]